MKSRILFLVLLLSLLGGCERHPQYSAAPFFSETGFSKVEVGMSENQVRDLLGYPVSRFGPIDPPASTITWEYTAPASSKSPLQYQVFFIKFGKDGRVASKLTCSGTWEPHEGVPKTIEAIQKLRRKIGNVVLTGFEGVTGKLQESDPGIYVILLDGDCPAGICQVNTGPKWFQETAPQLIEKEIITGIKHFYIGEKPDEYKNRVGSLLPDASNECYLSAQPVLDLTVMDLDSRILLYQAGILWTLPSTYGFTNVELAEDDQKWIIQKLGNH